MGNTFRIRDKALRIGKELCGEWRGLKGNYKRSQSGKSTKKYSNSENVSMSFSSFDR